MGLRKRLLLHYCIKPWCMSFIMYIQAHSKPSLNYSVVTDEHTTQSDMRHSSYDSCISQGLSVPKYPGKLFSCITLSDKTLLTFFFYASICALNNALRKQQSLTKIYYINKTQVSLIHLCSREDVPAVYESYSRASPTFINHSGALKSPRNAHSIVNENTCLG